MSAFITRDTAKTLLGITDTSKDALIDILLPMIQDQIITYCHNEFLDASGEYLYPGSVNLAGVKMLEFELNNKVKNVSSESIGDYSVTYTNDYPQSILMMLNKHRKLIFI